MGSHVRRLKLELSCLPVMTRQGESPWKHVHLFLYVPTYIQHMLPLTEQMHACIVFSYLHTYSTRVP